MRFEIYEAADGWRWRLIDNSNGNILADSGEAYSSKWNVKRAIKSLARKSVEVTGA